MEELVLKLQNSHPDITFKAGETFYWQATGKAITYRLTGQQSDPWSLLHEVGHAKLSHRDYTSDVDLLKKELAAWDEALTIADELELQIDRDHIEDCLDSYRDWVHRRSTCPNCALQGIQTPSSNYTCLNCSHTWTVTRARLCRPYRLSK